MKRIYFIRHGSTAENEREAYQLPDVPLSETGVAQAEKLAERLSAIPFDSILASDMERAHQTARIVGARVGKEVEKNPLLRELKRPTGVQEKSKTDPAVLALMAAAKEKWDKEGEHYSDEENFFDFKKRALDAIEHLKNRPEQTMVVVTHGYFLRMLITVMMKGADAQPRHYALIEQFIFPHNTGIAWCEFGNEFHPDSWQLFTWNDHSHLEG